MKSEKSTFFQMGEPSVNPETLENAINGDNYDPQTAVPAFFLVPGLEGSGDLAFISICLCVWASIAK